jgi:hypothetical protein
MPEAPVASPPPAAFSSPVEVIERPRPARAAAAPPSEATLEAEAPAPPPRGSLPPYSARREARAPAPEPEAAAPVRVAAAPAPVARPSAPSVLVSKTVWHPQRDRRVALVALEGGDPRELHEGDTIGPLVVSEIEPSGVVFELDGAPLRRKVGAKN